MVAGDRLGWSLIPKLTRFRVHCGSVGILPPRLWLDRLTTGDTLKSVPQLNFGAEFDLA